MSDNLFIDVTEEQQESVAGGLLIVSDQTSYNQVFKQFESIGPSKSSSGPNGSYASTGLATKSIQYNVNTSGISFGLVA